MMNEKLSAFYSRGVPLVNVWMALSFLVKMRLHQVSFTWPSIIMYLGCLVVSFFTDMVMSRLVNGLSRWRWMIAYLSTILRISTATSLTLFFDTTDTMIVLSIFCVVLALVIYLFHLMKEPGRWPELTWLDFRKQLDRKFEMSALVVAPSVAGLSGKVLGYVEGSSSNDLTAAGGHTAVAPEFLLFCSAVSGLLVVLFCTVPLPLSNNRQIDDVANVYIPIIAYAALSFLVGATVVAAEKILQEYVYLVCCLIAIIAGLLYLRDAQGAGSSAVLPETTRDTPEQRPLDEVREEEAKLSKTLCAVGILPILLAIMAIHSSYSGGSTVSLSWPWKAFVTLALCSNLSHTVRIFILDQMTELKRYEISRNFWTAVIYAVMTGTLVFGALVVWLHPDEVTNLF